MTVTTKEEDTKMISTKDDRVETIETDPDEIKFPYIPKDLVDSLKEVFDIRKIIWHETSRDTLMGIQQVIYFLEAKFEEQNNK